jgi:hypothetical protein
MRELTPIAAMVREMIARGIAPDAIVLAVGTAERAAALAHFSGIPVESVADKRRAYDRERKRKAAEFHRNSTGIPRKDENASLSSKNISSEDKKSKREATRGTRLPDDWRPSHPDLAMAQDLIGPDQTGIELAKFKDHWKQQAGSRGVKLDWSATWRNWVRRTREYAGARNGNRTGNTRATGNDAILAAASRKA